MEKETTPKYNTLDFDRDLKKGDQGEDVRKMQEILTFFGKKYGFAVDQKELDEQRFGDSTEEAAEKLRKEAAKNPALFTQDKAVAKLIEIVMQYVFHVDMDELNSQFARGKHKAIPHYMKDDLLKLSALQGGAKSTEPTNNLAANMATQFLGQRELPGNRGPMVALFNGKGGEGQPWCGGFVDFVMKKSYGETPKIYAQSNPLSAASFETEAKKYGAFHKMSASNPPQPGDVLVFNREGGRHVEIVKEVIGDEIVTIGGNKTNAVRESVISMSHPPRSLRGFSATGEIAEQKGIEMAQQPGSAVTFNPRAIARYTDAAVNRG